MTPGPRVVVVGSGRVGGSLAAALAAAGSDVSLRGRSDAADPDDGAAAPAEAAAHTDVPGSAEAPDPAAEPGAAASGADPSAEVPAGVVTLSGLPGPDDPLPHTLVFAVPDDRLEGVAASWADALDGAGGTDPGGADSGGAEPVALHTSGVHGPAVLDPLRSAGWATGGWHPLTAVAAVDVDAFRGCAVGLSGDPAAVGRGRSLAEAVGGRPIAVDEGAHARYHAAAVLASNGLVACLAAARQELAGATGGEGRLEDLLPLARAALEHVAARGLDGGLTGPVDRGDAGTVRRDMAALGPERAELYRRLARELLDLAGERLPEDRRRALRELLED